MLTRTTLWCSLCGSGCGAVGCLLMFLCAVVYHLALSSIQQMSETIQIWSKRVLMMADWLVVGTLPGVHTSTCVALPVTPRQSKLEGRLINLTALDTCFRLTFQQLPLTPNTSPTAPATGTGHKDLMSQAVWQHVACKQALNSDRPVVDFDTLTPAKEAHSTEMTFKLSRFP